MRRPIRMVLFASLILAACGGEEGGNSGDNIFSFNNVIRDMGNNTAADVGTMDAGDAGGEMDAEMDMGVDMAMEEDMGEPDMGPSGLQIQSVVPQTVAIAVTERAFSVQVNLVEALDQNVRITPQALPDGVTANAASIPSGRTSATVSFAVSNAAPFRGFVNLDVVLLDQASNPVGDPVSTRFEFLITAPAKVDFSQTVQNQILPVGTDRLSVTFDQPITDPSQTTMPVFSDIRGLLEGSYDGANSETLEFIPAGGFLPDEQLEMVINGLTTDEGDGLDRPITLLARMGSSPSTTFASPTSFTAPLTEAGPMIRLDFDDDGDVDVIAFDASGAANQVCLNNGAGSFMCNDFLLGTQVTSAVAGDFNNDGIIDFMIGSQMPSVETLCINTDGTIANLSCNDAGVFTAGYAKNLIATDVDQDGLLDVVGTPAETNPGGATGQRVFACANNGGSPPQFTCTESTSTTRFKVPEAHALYDFDGDGALDFIRSSSDPVRTEVCKPSGNRAYSCNSISTTDILFTADVAFIDPAMVANTFVLFSSPAGGQKYDVTLDAMGNVSVNLSAVPGLMGAFEATYLVDFDGDYREDGIVVQADGTTLACSNGGGSPPSLTCTQVLADLANATSASVATADFNGDDIIDIIVNTNAGGSFLSRQ